METIIIINCVKCKENSKIEQHKKNEREEMLQKSHP